tara:strand:- start:374 stop:2035 length:1662 start_codon:yes stop_codon:yes gene_type:complete
MAERTYNTLYDQLSPMDQMYYDQKFSKNYVPGKDNIMLTSQPAYDQMKAVYEAQQQVPEKSILDSINIFSKAGAAEPQKYGIGNIDMGAYYTPEMQLAIFGDPNYLGTNTPQYYEGTNVPVANVGEMLMNAGTTNFMDQFKTEPSVPQMSIEDQIQANIDRIQSTPGFEGYVPSGTPTQVNRPNMRDVAGDINLNMTDLGNPFNDSRVVSEEQGLVGGFVPTNRPNMRDVAGDINENLIDRGNPYNDSRVVSEEQGLAGGITDRGRGMPSPGEMEAYEMIGGTPVAIGDVLGRQYALEKADFYEPSKKGLTAGDALGIMGLMSGSNPLKAMSALANRQKIGQMLGNVKNRISSGIGSLNKKMRGVNPITGRANTQAQWEQARTERQQQKRTDRMIDRIASGKRTRSNPRDAGTTKAQKDAISAAIQDAARTGQYNQNDGGPSGGKSIVCTAMYQTTGLKDWSKAMKVWYIYQKKHLTDTHQEGYHWLFKPFVKVMKKSKIIEALGAHVAKHRTQELKHILFNAKADKLGKVYNAILEPLCYVAGKIKSALGRG